MSSRIDYQSYCSCSSTNDANFVNDQLVCEWNTLLQPGILTAMTDEQAESACETQLCSLGNQLRTTRIPDPELLNLLFATKRAVQERFRETPQIDRKLTGILYTELIQLFRQLQDMGVDQIGQILKQFQFSPDERIEIANKFIEIDVTVFVQCLFYFEITNQPALKRLIEKCLKSNAETTIKNLDVFALGCEESRVDIARLCANQDCKTTSSYLYNFALSPPHEREIEEICNSPHQAVIQAAPPSAPPVSFWSSPSPQYSSSVSQTVPSDKSSPLGKRTVSPLSYTAPPAQRPRFAQRICPDTPLQAKATVLPCSPSIPRQTSCEGQEDPLVVKALLAKEPEALEFLPEYLKNSPEYIHTARAALMIEVYKARRALLVIAQEQVEPSERMLLQEFILNHPLPISRLRIHLQETLIDKDKAEPFLARLEHLQPQYEEWVKNDHFCQELAHILQTGASSHTFGAASLEMRNNIPLFRLVLTYESRYLPITADQMTQLISLAGPDPKNDETTRQLIKEAQDPGKIRNPDKFDEWLGITQNREKVDYSLFWGDGELPDLRRKLHALSKEPNQLINGSLQEEDLKDLGSHTDGHLIKKYLVLCYNALKENNALHLLEPPPYALYSEPSGAISTGGLAAPLRPLLQRVLDQYTHESSRVYKFGYILEMLRSLRHSNLNELKTYVWTQRIEELTPLFGPGGRLTNR